MAAGLEHGGGEIGGGLAQMHGAQMVGLAVAGGRRRHVGKHYIDRLTAERSGKRGRRVLVERSPS